MVFYHYFLLEQKSFYKFGNNGGIKEDLQSVNRLTSLYKKIPFTHKICEISQSEWVILLNQLKNYI